MFGLPENSSVYATIGKKLTAFSNITHSKYITITKDNNPNIVAKSQNENKIKRKG